MSMSEFEKSRPRFNPRELEGLAKIVEAFPKDPKMAAAEDLRRRIWLALKSPAYKYDDRAALFKAVRETVRSRANRVETPKLTVVETPAHKKRLAPSPIVVADLIKDAYAHEKRQPADTYDVDAEEEARKPLSSE